MIEIKVFAASLLVVAFWNKGLSQCETPADTVTTSILTCTPYTWSINGSTYEASTHLEVVDGDCNLQILNLTIYENQVESRRIFTCGSYFWSVTGETYTSSDTYSYQETTSEGCVIDHQLVLTVSDAYNSSEGAADCDTFQWQAMDFPSGGMVGKTVDLDASGTILAVGSDTAGTSGEVKVYQWSESGWSQMGATLTAEFNPEKFGASVSLSANGKYLAVGSPSRNPVGGFATYGQVKVFEWSGTDWLQRGTTINGIDDFDELGFSVDLSNDGNILAVGAPSSGRVALELGEVRVYQWTGGDWQQMGNHIYKHEFLNSANNNGYSVSLSGDGTKLMFGAPFSHGILKNTPGKYFVFEWDGAQWGLVQGTQGSTNQERMGWSVALTNDGAKFAVGSPAYNSNAGKVFSSYQILEGEVAGASFGKSIAINSDAQIMAVGSPLYSSATANVGKVEVFHDAGEGYQQIGQDIVGTTASQQLGSAIALNHSGNIMAVNGQVYYYGCANTTQNCTASLCTGLITSKVDTSACYSYTFDGVPRYESGTYEATFTSQDGCDSLVTLNLTIIPTVYYYDITACNSYVFNGDTLTSGGIYSTWWSASTTYSGCDSTVQITLTITDTLIETEESVTACGSYEFGGKVLTETGIYYDTISGGSTCDSLITLNLTIAAQDVVNESIEACESYAFGGDILTTSGVYEKTFTNQFGCDSLVTLDLTIGNGSSETIAVTSCESYEFNSEMLTSSGIYEAAFTNSAGCDSLVSLNLTILEGSSEMMAVTSCENYEFNGETLTSSGTYHATLTNSVGCDSLVTLTLTIIDSTGTATVAACESYISPSGKYTWTSSGSYTDTLLNTSGCNSIVTVNLTINHSSAGTHVVTACDSYTWIDGNTYTSSNNSATYTLTNSMGCDSLVTLDLTILKSTSGSQDLEVCGSYDWEGTTYTESGTYMVTLTSSGGCDSTATLNLTILEASAPTVTESDGVLFVQEQNGATYQWYDCDKDEPIGNQTHPQFTPMASGSFAVSVSNGACISLSECVTVEAVILGAKPADGLEIYPNPTTTGFRVRGINEPAQVTVMTVSGKILSKHVYTSSETEIPIPGLSGVYLIKVEFGDKTLLKKVFKAH